MDYVGLLDWRMRRGAIAGWSGEDGSSLCRPDRKLKLSCLDVYLIVVGGVGDAAMSMQTDSREGQLISQRGSNFGDDERVSRPCCTCDLVSAR